jgi:hypothetical protein
MKIILFTLTTAFFYGVFMSATATAAGQNGGGGAQIDAAFRTTGYSLIARIGANPAANAYCDATTLQSALDKSNVRIVDRLVNPKTNEPITENLDAWTIPGDIQLLKSSWSGFVGPNSLIGEARRSIGALIIHEIYRATGVCNDDRFRITDRIFQLINGGELVHKNFSEGFTFKVAYYTVDFAKDGDSYYHAHYASCPLDHRGGVGGILLCDRVAVAGGEATCLYVGFNSEADLYKNLKFTAVDVGLSGLSSCLQIEDRLNDRNSDESFLFSFGPDIDNQIQFISAEHPFVFVHDIRAGKWSGSMQ